MVCTRKSRAQGLPGVATRRFTDIADLGINALTQAYGNCFSSIWGVAKALKPSPGFGQPRKGKGPYGHSSWLGYYEGTNWLGKRRLTDRGVADLW